MATRSADPPRQASPRARPKSARPVPPFDAGAVGRVGGRVQIETLELVRAAFSRADTDPLVSDPGTLTPDKSGLSIDWQLSEDSKRLGCVITFGTAFEGQVPYEVVASFRLIYTIPDDGPPPSESDIENFVHWNAVGNAWPYWREYLSSTVNRAGLRRFVAPVLRVPLPGMTEPG